MSWTSNESNITAQQLFKSATYEIGEILIDIKIRYTKRLNEIVRSSYYIKLPMVNGLKVTEQRKRSHLRCWTIALYPNMTTAPISYIRFNLWVCKGDGNIDNPKWLWPYIYRAIPVRYYIHKEGQFLNLNGKVPLSFSLGGVQHAQISTWDMQLLNDEYVDNNCQDDDTLFDDCLYNALESRMVSATKTRCTVPWTRNNSRICSNPNDVKKAFRISWFRGTNQVPT